MEIVLASANLHKIREFRDMFKSLTHIELISMHQFNHYISPEETGQSFKENAIMKATHAAAHLNKWVLADDSGLIVPALQGEPGVKSRRYAGPDATDSENRMKLLQAMERLDGQERTAYFECCLALACPMTGLKKCVEGICEGYIVKEARGRHGFGYDPLFIKNDYEKTFAELDETIKNRISHRRKAFERLLTFLETLKKL
jgi:XTP/dITP diphosphohydrolase